MYNRIDDRTGQDRTGQDRIVVDIDSVLPTESRYVYVVMGNIVLMLRVDGGIAC